ncbi:erythromycin esterase [Actinoplanes octamycinicus]|uniref:Erythromycin esterase n=1 Tax=Actinoplanes octamycinicus TaxID=135948 RepID=A0A7W7H200_9ACTN|nr:erythromycin esterase family protein [Actinoplanes octamycinicus]MBB4742525.1 erythromycin esterase [Actinoplanes octamycinicus]GIE60863.1 erythromycin esterase [Actinoplanes octamycinicus]
MPASLDDLESLPTLIGDAQVVGIGESAHDVREFQQLRGQIVRFLVERMGFTAFALESGFSEGLLIDRWVHGSPPGDDIAVVAEQGLTYGFGAAQETRELLTWLREHNAGGGDVRFAGLDLPADLGSLLPALEGVARYLAEVDPAAITIVDHIRTYARSWASPYTMAALRAYRATPAADRDALTLLLSELATRVDALRPLYERRGGASGHVTARHELRLAVLLDQMLRAQAAAAGGSGIHAAVNVRDAAMAETVRHLLRDGRRIVVSAANTHLQRIPIMLGGTFEVPVLGSHLAGELGEAYHSIAVTAVSGRTPTRRPAPGTERGVEVLTVDLAPPAPGSVEAFLAGPASPRLTDLRPLRGAPDGPQRFRNLDGYIDLPVADAFDLVAVVPHLA